MLKFMKKEYLCPFCFTRHEVDHVAFRCVNAAKHASKNVEVFANPGRGTGMLKKMPEEAICPSCGDTVRQRVCPAPECGKQLPKTIDEFEDYIIAIIGAKNAGKSHYICMLKEEIEKRIGSAFHCSLSALTDTTINRYRHDFYIPVFDELRTIGGTRSATTDEMVRTPMIYMLSFFEKAKQNWLGKLLGQKGQYVTTKVVTLVFFDTAGEDLNQEDVMSQVNKYIYNSSGIIFLLDPLQLPAVRQQLGLSGRPADSAYIEDLIDRTANLIRKAKNIPSDKAIDIPLAVTFSKMDAITGLLDSNNPLDKQSKHITEGRFSRSDFNSVNTQMQLLLEEWGQAGFINKVRGSFASHAYFGVSALGCDPQDNKLPHEPRAKRVEDPFLWLLEQNGIISGK